MKDPIKFRISSFFVCFNNPLHPLEPSNSGPNDLTKALNLGKKLIMFLIRNQLQWILYKIDQNHILKSGYHDCFAPDNVEWFVGKK